MSRPYGRNELLAGLLRSGPAPLLRQRSRSVCDLLCVEAGVRARRAVHRRRRPAYEQPGQSCVGSAARDRSHDGRTQVGISLYQPVDVGRADHRLWVGVHGRRGREFPRHRFTYGEAPVAFPDGIRAARHLADHLHARWTATDPRSFGHDAHGVGPERHRARAVDAVKIFLLTTNCRQLNSVTLGRLVQNPIQKHFLVGVLVSDRNHFLPPGPSDSFASFTATDTPADSPGAFREGLPPAFRMRADAHYVEQLDGATPAVTVQFIAVHVIDVSDAPADALPALVDSIKRHGVLEPLVVQRNNGTYRTITGEKRLAAARAAGLRDVPCLVHHVSDERAQMLRELLRSPVPAPVSTAVQTETIEPAASAPASVMDVAITAMRLAAGAPEASISIVKTAAGAPLSVGLPFTV